MGALAPVAPKLAKLIPMLGSDRDGEALATVRAIERTLKAAGLDFHALAAALEHEETRPPHADSGHYDAVDHDQLVKINTWITCNAMPHLCEKERKFVNDMAFKFAAGWHATPRQRKWICDIYARVCVWEARA